MKIIGKDNLNRENIADTLLLIIPDREEAKAKEFCVWLNTFSCDESGGGTYFSVVPNNYRLSRGMEDLI